MRSQHRALLALIAPHGQPVWQLAHSRPCHNLQPGHVVIRTTHVALNPFDWQGVAFRFGVDSKAKVMGRDGAGVIVGVGKNVTRFQPGDRVWFCANSAHSDAGAFQEYSVHSASHVAHTPPNICDAQAATLGTGLVTAGVALLRALHLPCLTDSSLPKNKRPWILIWGGSGSTGMALVQIAHYLGYRVICTASLGNHDYVRSLGADLVLDRRRSPTDLVDKIREATDDDVEIAIDNVSKATAYLCRKVLEGSHSWRSTHGLSKGERPQPAQSARLLPLAGYRDENNEIGSSDGDTVRRVEMLKISFSTTFYAQPEFSETLLDTYTTMLQNQDLVASRVQIVENGLYGIEKGLEDLREGRVLGGHKLVARLSDTPVVSDAESDRD